MTSFQFSLTPKQKFNLTLQSIKNKISQLQKNLGRLESLSGETLTEEQKAAIEVEKAKIIERIAKTQATVQKLIKEIQIENDLNKQNPPAAASGDSRSGVEETKTDPSESSTETVSPQYALGELSARDLWDKLCDTEKSLREEKELLKSISNKDYKSKQKLIEKLKEHCEQYADQFLKTADQQTLKEIVNDISQDDPDSKSAAHHCLMNLKKQKQTAVVKQLIDLLKPFKNHDHLETIDEEDNERIYPAAASGDSRGGVAETKAETAAPSANTSDEDDENLDELNAKDLWLRLCIAQGIKENQEKTDPTTNYTNIQIAAENYTRLLEAFRNKSKTEEEIDKIISETKIENSTQQKVKDNLNPLITRQRSPADYVVSPEIYASLITRSTSTPLYETSHTPSTSSSESKPLPWSNTKKGMVVSGATSVASLVAAAGLLLGAGPIGAAVLFVIVLAAIVIGAMRSRHDQQLPVGPVGPANL